MRTATLALLLTAAVLALSPAAEAQHHHGAVRTPSSASPYAGFEKRPIKGLSDEQVADLKAGRGAGLALPAELNGYPGPLHVLELGDRLALTDEQRAHMRHMIESMRAETIAIGEALLTEERLLDRLFSGKSATEASIQGATSRIGELQGRLRAAHLKYHLTTVDILSPAQIARYGELRGYGSAHGAR